MVSVKFRRSTFSPTQEEGRGDDDDREKRKHRALEGLCENYNLFARPKCYNAYLK